MSTRSSLFAVALTLAVSAAALVTTGHAQEPRQPQADTGMPDLVGGLKSTPGCLGVEVAMTQSGKSVIFAWFQDKQAVLKWYYSDTHQQVMDSLFADGEADHKPLEGIPDDAGPIMAIASLTMAGAAHLKETSLPVSQIAIELYQPIAGGLFLGGRFAPEGVKVGNMHDYTPRD